MLVLGDCSIHNAAHVSEVTTRSRDRQSNGEFQSNRASTFAIQPIKRAMDTGESASPPTTLGRSRGGYGNQ